MLAAGSRVVAWLIVIVVALATAAGLFARFLTPDGAPYLLVTREVGDHPVVAALLLLLSLTAYVAGTRRLARVLDRWRDGTAERPPSSGRAVRVRAFVDYVFGRWYRVSLVLLVVWLPLYATSFPGQPSPDAANMLTEFLRTRSDFAGASPFAGPDGTAPYIDYPTSSFLLDDSTDSLWSNHHPLYLMLGYGSIASASTHLFGSLVPGLMLISFGSATFTLVAFGRGLTLVGAMVADWRVRGAALLVTALCVLIPLWSLAIHKNQLFCAAFVWWLGLLARFLHGRAPVGRRWVVETGLVSLVMAISVQFGWIVLVAQAVVLLAVKRQRLVAPLTLAAPALAVFGSIAFITAQGGAIASDPVETKGLQMQTTALILREHPDALTPEQREQLSRIFDLDAMVASFDPSSSDPLKSTGPLNEKTSSLRYETVQREDWDAFQEIWLDLAKRYPGTFLDGLFLKSYRYLDPLDEETDWYPPWSHKYERNIGEYQAAPMDFNYPARKAVRLGFYHCYEDALPCRVLISHPPKTVAVVLLCAAAILVRRRFAWVWAVPFALQIAIAAVSPLSAGGRYVLACTYGVGLLVMLLAVSDRIPERVRDRTPSDSPGSSTPSPPP